MRILMLCTGNICRSPLAEAAMARELPGHEVSSAGLRAIDGMPADATARELAAAQGLDLTAHRARRLHPGLWQAADVVFVMDTDHLRELIARAPTVQGKAFRLGHLGGFDIADPYQQPREAFDAAWAAIARGVADWVPRLQRL